MIDKKYRFLKELMISFCTVVLFGCGNVTPEQNFNIAVLNTNMLAGFATNGLSRQLESPSEKLSGDGQSSAPMKSSEIIKTKIEFIEESYNKLEDLKETEDSKEIISASKDLYQFVLPVYKTEYVKLAEMYDSGTSPEQIKAFTDSIHDKYYEKYNELYNKLIEKGKVYAQKHNIKVNWGNN